jgi:uroporphyrinogen-III decarboxylase
VGCFAQSVFLREKNRSNKFGVTHMSMTQRELQLATLTGGNPDRIPWMPRLEIWYTAHYLAGTLPPEFAGMRLGEIQKELGVGKTARGGHVFTTRMKGVEVHERRVGLETYYDYVTPVGTVSRLVKRTPELDVAGIQPLEIEHFIKKPEDIDTVMYIVENTEYFEAYEQFNDFDESVGDDGLPMIPVGDVPFHQYLEVYDGYEKGYLDLFDYPDKVERLLETMHQVYKEKMWPLAAKSPGTLFLHGAHFSSETTPANYFEEYMLGYMQEFADYMHGYDKKVAHHADNDTSAIIELLRDSRYDMHECFVTDPMVPMTISKGREVLGDDIVIFGGVPSVILEEAVSDDQFEKYMQDIFDAVKPGDRFILGIADNMMPTSMLSRVKRVGELAEQQGTYS